MTFACHCLWLCQMILFVAPLSLNFKDIGIRETLQLILYFRGVYAISDFHSWCHLEVTLRSPWGHLEVTLRSLTSPANKCYSERKFYTIFSRNWPLPSMSSLRAKTCCHLKLTQRHLALLTASCHQTVCQRQAIGVKMLPWQQWDKTVHYWFTWSTNWWHTQAKGMNLSI